VHTEGADGSGTAETLSGWLAAFCYWNERGNHTYQYGNDGTDMPATEEADRRRLVIDGIVFPVIATRGIPRAMTEVPVKILDFGAGIQYDTTVVAGFVGVESTASKKGKANDTVQPRAGYWMLVDKVSPMPEDVEDPCNDARKPYPDEI
jgi:hypothetical protein